MIAKTIAILFTLGVATAWEKPYAGVDPNTLSCDPEGQVFLLLPHYESCTLYYQCSNGREILMPGCSAPLIFDFELQGCNWERDATCILRTPPGEEDPEEEEDSDNQGDGGSGDEVEGSGEEIEDIDDGSGSGYESDVDPDSAVPTFDILAHLHGQVQEVSPGAAAVQSASFTAFLDCRRADFASRHIPYRGDCQRFWRCVDGVAHTFYCSDGLFFNERTQMCDFEANVSCFVNHDDELEGEFIVYK